jgi:hypothetical protein
MRTRTRRRSTKNPAAALQSPVKRRKVTTQQGSHDRSPDPSATLTTFVHSNTAFCGKTRGRFIRSGSRQKEAAAAAAATAAAAAALVALTSGASSTINATGSSSSTVIISPFFFFGGGGLYIARAREYPPPPPFPRCRAPGSNGPSSRAAHAVEESKAAVRLGP